MIRLWTLWVIPNDDIHADLKSLICEAYLKDARNVRDVNGTIGVEVTDRFGVLMILAMIQIVT